MFWFLVGVGLAAPPALGPGHAELEAANERIQRAFLKSAASAGGASEWQDAAAALASRELGPLKAQLVARGRWRLTQLTAGVLDRRAYTPVEEAAALDGTLEALKADPNLIPKMGPEMGAVLAIAWDPVRVLMVMRSMLHARAFGPRVMGRRALLDNFAPPRVRLLVATPEAPVLAAWSGPEVVVVTLELDPGIGAWLPTKVEWLRERAAK